MAFNPDEMKQLAEMVVGVVRQEVAAAVGAMEREAPAAAAQSRESLVGVPDVPHDAGPEFYVHLSDGSVITTHDSTSTHMQNGEGEQCLVIGRYQKGA